MDPSSFTLEHRLRPRPHASVTAGARRRVDAVDVLRGVIMVLMALDHVRDYFGAMVNPTDPATTTVPLFLTRWITHVCAPVFFLLTGVGAQLALERRTRHELSRFLLTRGAWLIFLEVVVVRSLGWQFNFDYRLTVLTVLWALGWAMIVLAALVHLRARTVATIGVAMIVAHNLLDGIPATALGSLAPLWTFIHAPGVLYADGRHVVFAAYVLVPWVGVTAAGYGLGAIYRWEPERRRALLLRLGLGAIVAFVVLRALNAHGDPAPWTAQPRGASFTALSFLNTSKYPPSLLYLLMTLGPALLALRALDGRTRPRLPAVLRPALVIGRVPLFYYLLHVPLIHLLAVVASGLRYGAVHWMFESPSLDRYPITQPPGWPLPLPAVYLIWIAVVAMLYPLCRWFAGVKQRRRDPWLSYL